MSGTRAAIAELPRAKSLSKSTGIEGKAAYAYWLGWHGLEIHWKQLSRNPVPEEWWSFKSRSSVLNSGKLKNHRASSPVNAMLNFAYTVLLTGVRINAIADGYDPMLGILHDQKAKKKERTPSFALGLMEPLRPVVGRAALNLISEESFSGADFQLQSDGVCRLNPELAWRVVAAASNEVGLARAG